MYLVHRSLRSAASMIALSAMLGACSLIPDYERPAMGAPAAFDGAAKTDSKATVAADWWTAFKAPELEALMTDALANNLDIAAALARIDQAQGALRSTNSSLLPQVSASGSATGADSSNNLKSNTRSASGDLSISYALDLWGKYRAQSAASEASFRATQFDHDATVLLIQSSVATTYFNVLTLKDRLTITQDSLKAALEILNLVEQRYKFGAISALDLAQQRANVATIQAGIPTIEDQLNSNRNALAILLGRAPEGFTVKTEGTAMLTLPTIAVGQPSSLLVRRPDIRRAEAQLQSANANIGAARAAFFPSLDLSAARSVDWVADIGTTNGSSIAASLLAPIFSGGSLEGSLQSAKAAKAELVATYRKTVLTSFGEVENAMSSEDANARRVEALKVAADETRKAYDLSEESYKAGAIDFSSLLDAQRSWLSARDSLAQARLAQYTAAVNLFIALGGGWQS